MRRLSAVQTAHLDLEAIDDGVLCLSGERYRAVVEVGAINFGLQGDAERSTIVAGFAAFLNSLTFPIQILVRVVPIDIGAYLDDLERRALQLPSKLADLAFDHAAFLRRLARSRTLLERRFYVVVPADPPPLRPRLVWPFRPQDARIPDREAPHKQLTFRCEEVARQLQRCGLSARRLGDVELAQLSYACWCPELSRVQRLRRALDEYVALVVRADDLMGRAA